MTSRSSIKSTLQHLALHTTLRIDTALLDAVGRNGARNMTVWYYAVGQEREGPVDQDKIEKLIVGGVIGRDAYIWREGMADWQVVADHPDFCRVFFVCRLLCLRRLRYRLHMLR